MAVERAWKVIDRAARDIATRVLPSPAPSPPVEPSWEIIDRFLHDELPDVAATLRGPASSANLETGVYRIDDTGALWLER